MKDREKFTFFIEHLDPLGQGVDKSSDKVTFIPKVLPNESGIAEIINSSKGVRFAKLVELETSSVLRQVPSCPHFENCSGCDYLHTDYDNELGLKEISFRKIFSKLMDEVNIEIIKAPSRLSYRNRIQLHYDTKRKILGFHKYKSKEIIPVPECLIAVDEISRELKNLYKGNNWLKEAPKDRPHGHLEIYLNNNKLIKTWNDHYSSGGFSQVYELMNQKLKNIVKSEASNLFNKNSTILDLFSGNANLTQDIEATSKFHFDSFPQDIKNFYEIDLFKDHDLSKFACIKSNNENNFIIDPPRSGFKNIVNWTKYFAPKNIIYVSCNPFTLARDLDLIKDDYKIKTLSLIDLFPATKHFESIAICTKL
jgi:23S rRNA (uracil1939-C5)-methyltransferase